MSSCPPRKTCLHLVIKASGPALEGCRSQFDDGDVVLFLDDGVLQVLGVHSESRPLPLPLQACCFCSEDLEARGLSGVASEAGLRVLPTAEVAALLIEHDHCVTWK